MYICYLDESGVTEKHSSTDHFILIGVAIPADTWKAKDHSVVEIKKRFGLKNEEIHTAWMLRKYPEQDRIKKFDRKHWDDRRKEVLAIRSLNLSRPRTNKKQKELLKNYRKTAAYIHLTLDERKRCISDLADLVGSWDDARLFGEAYDKNNAAIGEPFDVAFEQVVTRFNTFLSLAVEQYGILVQDNNETVCRRLTHSMRRFHLSGTLWTSIDKIIETPLFVDSSLTSMVQISDLCAYATRRFFDKGETYFFDKIYSRFDRNRGKCVGLRHFTGTYACKCKVCIDHGRY